MREFLATLEVRPEGVAVSRRRRPADGGAAVAATVVAVPVLSVAATALAFDPVPPEVIALGPEWAAKWPEASPALRRLILWTAHATDDEIIALDDYSKSRRKGGEA